jgi:integrase
MRRYSKGGVVQQRGRWKGLWYEDGIKKSRIVGLCKEMTKTEARQAVEIIIAKLKPQSEKPLFGDFVENVYFPYYTRKWKESTRENNQQRMRTHLLAAFRDRPLDGLLRDELQDFMDSKGNAGLSFSVVDHLRWDLKQIFDMAVAEGKVVRNPALLLFTPKTAPKPIHRAMTVVQVRQCFSALNRRERLIAKLAILAGMRPGEIFAMTWGRLTATHADIMQRIYRRKLDKPKTDNSTRHAALSAGLLADIEAWRSVAIAAKDDAWVFPSERMTPLSKDNCWRRSMLPKLEAVGLGWCNFQVMRRTHATLMRQLKADPKLVADQLGHTVDVSLNVYAQSPVAGRAVIVNELEMLVQ